MGKLTHKGIAALTRPGKYADGGGLFLRVTASGSRQWIQRITIGGRERALGLGGWPLVSIKAARDLAVDNRRAVAAGRDPLAEKREAAAPTVREAAQRTLAANRARWRNAKTAKNWNMQLEKHAFPKIGDRPVTEIGRADVLAVLVPIWNERPAAARKVRTYLRAIFSWAQAYGLIELNPAGDAVDGALPKLPSVRAHYRALPFEQVPAALAAVDAGRATRVVKGAMRFLALTACRAGEVRGALWSEIDLDARLWTIPAARMKSNREHRVPLSDAALQVLDTAREWADKSGLIFPSRNGKPLSDMALLQALKRAGVDAVPHGFRSSFRVWAAEKTSADWAAMELCLAHAVGSSVERSYARSDLLEKRRRLMDSWAAFVTGRRGRVLRMA